MEKYKGDKRSKEYRQWKKNLEQSSKGFGDKVEKVFKATGIDKAAKFLLGEDCGCEERKDTLNKIFPSKKINCLTEEEYNYLANFFESKPSTVKPDIQKELIVIYNRIFNERAGTTGCNSCFAKGIFAKLKQVFNEYND
tara:strand:+ start:2657 stop:3073 length:417 start_codon:yes stop_codon:yes gene_type:complete